MTEQIKPYSAITPENIQDWKAKYGLHAIHELTVPLMSEEDLEEGQEMPEAKFIIRDPDRKVLLASTDAVKKGNEAKANDIYINSCVLGGDIDAIDQYGFVYLRIVQEASNIYKKTQGVLKKI